MRRCGTPPPAPPGCPGPLQWQSTPVPCGRRQRSSSPRRGAGGRGRFPGPCRAGDTPPEWRQNSCPPSSPYPAPAGHLEFEGTNPALPTGGRSPRCALEGWRTPAPGASPGSTGAARPRNGPPLPSGIDLSLSPRKRSPRAPPGRGGPSKHTACFHPCFKMWFQSIFPAAHPPLSLAPAAYPCKQPAATCPSLSSRCSRHRIRR